MAAASDNKIRAVITGSTGMVGEGVVHECLQSDMVEAVLIINRRPSGIEHPKLKEILLADFFNFKSLEKEVAGYNACYFCLGMSSVGVSKDEYYKMTYTLTMGVAEVLSRVNRDMVFCYISGAGTDTSEEGNVNWARVKGKTENDLMKLPFKKVYAFRPGFIKPTPGLKRTLGAYKYIGWLYPVLKTIAPGSASTLAEIGQAMINVVNRGYKQQVIEVADIVALAQP